MVFYVVKDGPWIVFITQNEQKAIDYKNKYYISDITIQQYTVE